MMQTNVQRYSTVAMAMHWGLALLMIYMIFFGEGLIKGEPWNKIPPSNPGLHASLGLLILALSVLRLVWRLVNPPPADVPMPRWQATGSHVLHWGFYALMILLPLSGMADLDKAIAGKHPEFAGLTFFNLFTVPHYSATWFAALHDPMSKVAMFLLFLHVAAAMKHQFIDKDRLINRMLPY